MLRKSDAAKLRVTEIGQIRPIGTAGYGVHVDVLHCVLSVYFLQAARMSHDDYPDMVYLRTAQAKKSKFGNVMPVVVVFCNLFCIHFLHKYSFRKVKYLMLRKSDAAKLRVTRCSF